MIKIILISSLLYFLSYPADPVSVDFHYEKEISAVEIYTQLEQQLEKPPRIEVIDFALKGWYKMRTETESTILTIIDFSLPSTDKRLWIIDLEENEILLNTLVSHGRNSGELFATSFSNKPESYQSSLGFYKTGETYYGKHGYSLRLDGLEKGFNDEARNRAIVIHGADYAREEFAIQTGRLGRSLGCPAIPKELSKEVIDHIKDGSLLLIYAEQANYLNNSLFGQP